MGLQKCQKQNAKVKNTLIIDYLNDLVVIILSKSKHFITHSGTSVMLFLGLTQYVINSSIYAAFLPKIFNLNLIEPLYLTFRL